MWMLDNRTPFAADRTWVRDRDGVHHWIVVVKATFQIAPDGRLTLAEEPLPPLHLAEYHGEAGVSSVRYEADLVPLKPATDVYLNAVAYQPDGRSRTELLVSLRIGRLQKDLIVYGDRTWRRSSSGGVTPSAPDGFTEMPIVYERAYGGLDQDDPNLRKQRIDFRNPVGRGVAASSDQLLGTPAPNIEHPRERMGDGWPAGYGALASFWSPRKELAGTYDEHWEAERAPLLPTDFDPQHLLCAPIDQQVPGYLAGGEYVELTNLTPSSRLRFRLPAVDFFFDTYFGARRYPHRARLTSVVIDTPESRVALVWQSSLMCANEMDYLDRTVIRCGDRW
jgi:hypothetical protein